MILSTSQNGNFQGVMGIDISLDMMNECVKNISFDGHSKGFIVDTAGMIIAQSDGGIKENNMQKSEFFKQRWQEIKDTKNDFSIEKATSVNPKSMDQAQSISAATEEIASSSKALENMTEDMQAMIRKFKF